MGKHWQPPHNGESGKLRSRMTFVGIYGERIAGDRSSLLIFIFVLLLVILQIFLILVSLGKLPPQIPFFYSRPWGEKMLAPPLVLWILPMVAIFSLVINYSLAIFWLSNFRFLWRVLVIFSLVVGLMTLYDMVKIISLLI